MEWYTELSRGLGVIVFWLAVYDAEWITDRLLTFMKFLMSIDFLTCLTAPGVVVGPAALSRAIDRELKLF